jgi:O-antigen ligase
MTNEKLFKIVYISFFFIAFGVFVSVSVPALFHIVAAIPMMMLTYKFFKEGNKLPSSAWILLAYALWAYITNLINFTTLQDPVRNFGRQKYELFSIMLIPTLFYMQGYMNTFRWRKLSTVFFFTLLAAAIYGIVASQLRFDLLKMAPVPEGYNVRSRGFIGIMRYGYGCGLVLSMLIACIPFLKKEIKIFNQKWFWIALVSSFLGMYFAKTRGAFVGVAASIPFIIWYFHRRFSIISMIVVAAMGIGTIVYIKNAPSSNRLFAKLGNDSNMKRISQYHTAALSFLEKPIHGHGVGQFSHRCSETKNKYGIRYHNYCEQFDWAKCNFKHRPQYCSHSHNVILEHLANRGFIGATLLTAFFLMWLFEAYRRQDIMSVVFTAFIINFLVSGQFEETFNANISFLLYFLYPLNILPIPERFKLQIS